MSIGEPGRCVSACFRWKKGLIRKGRAQKKAHGLSAVRFVSLKIYSPVTGLFPLQRSSFGSIQGATLSAGTSQPGPSADCPSNQW